MISRVGIISNNKKAEAIEASRFIKTELNRIGVDVWIEDSQCGLELLDFLVILGGDGTVLHSFQKYGELEIPFLCINFGSVGFLSSISPHELAEYWSCIVNGLYRIEERSVLNIAILRKNQNLEYYYALNDLVIRSNRLHISRQILRIDGRDINEYGGDGLIIATPTGSTGYSLSAGGSIVEPILKIYTITPLVSRKKALDSLVIGMNHNLEIICNDSESQSKPFIDGIELAPLEKGDLIRIGLGDIKAKFVVLNPDRYFNLLRHKGE